MEITKAQLRTALKEWEENARSKKAGTPFKKDYRKMATKDMAKMAADYFWPILKKHAAKGSKAVLTNGATGSKDVRG